MNKVECIDPGAKQRQTYGGLTSQGVELRTIIKSLIAVIPYEEKRLTLRLEAVLKSSTVAAPEMQPHWWRTCRQILFEEIGNPCVDWEHCVAKIWLAHIEE